MKRILYLTVLLSLGACAVPHNEDSLKIWYETPALSKTIYRADGSVDNVQWLSALPLGNGSLGAMVYGDVPTDRIQINEESLWSGSHEESDNPDAAAELEKIHRLLFEGKYKEATDLTYKTQICRGKGSGRGRGNGIPYGCYETLGDLWFDFDNKTEYRNYRRELDLRTAVARVHYSQGKVSFQREMFISRPDQVMVFRYTADHPGEISFTCRMNRPQHFSTGTRDGQLIMSGALPDGKGGDGMQYIARLKALNKNGTVSYTDSTVRVKDADEVLLLVTASTDYKQEYPVYKGRDHIGLSAQALDKACHKPYREIYNDHVAEYSPYFNRVDFNLTQAVDTLATDRCVAQAAEGKINPHLYELMFHFGRYLLISSSRPGTLPANLQGIWAQGIHNPWNCDYHTDVNIQMNYWPAEVTNLSECHLPYFELLKSLVKPGSRTAQVQYGMKGWVVHPITNVWGYTSPGETAKWGMHTGAPAWLCQHIMEHYRYTGDLDFLREMYPTLKGAVEFYLDWLTRDPETGKWVSGPAVSPENTFEAPDGSRSQISMGPTHDQQTIWQLFDDFIKASGLLKQDDGLVRKTAAVQAELLPNRIGSDGRLMEWAHEFKEVEPGHRHFSHLFAVYPGSQINAALTPGLLEAARKSLDFRIANGGGTGWSAAWQVCQYSRMKEAGKALNRLDHVMKHCIYPNLFTKHPPFQMDANFGTTAGIAEMLIQSHIQDGDIYVIELLPALPESWKDGSFSGLKARGGFEVAVEWENGKISRAGIKSLLGNPCRISWQGETINLTLAKGETKNLTR